MNSRDRLELLPLRQMVSASGDAALRFARQDLLDGFGRPDRYRLKSHGAGGQILASGDLALAEARAVLAQAYGASVSFGVPTVHTYRDTPSGILMVPVIFLRVDAPRPHAHELRQLLARRGAELKEVDLKRHRVVVRAELELSRALGVAAEIGALTDGAAQVLSWLLRYQDARHSERANA